MQFTSWSPRRILAIGALAGLAIGAVAVGFVRPQYDSAALMTIVRDLENNQPFTYQIDSLSESVLAGGSCTG